MRLRRTLISIEEYDADPRDYDSDDPVAICKIDKDHGVANPSECIDMADTITVTVEVIE
jgi:hypothetical protein